MSRPIHDIIKVATSNLIVLISGILVSLFLPKIISIQDYSNYKVFTLYATYIGVFLLGFNDGIYLKYGGYSYQQLPLEKFRCYSRYIFILTILFSFLLLIGAIFVDKSIAFILVALSLYTIPFNIIGYFQQISQATQRFNEYSKLKIINSILSIVIIAIMFILSKSTFDNIVNYKTYVIFFIIINLIISIWYISTYKTIIFGSAESFRGEKKEIVALHKLGIPLLIANFTSILLLNLDRQFVSMFFDSTTYAMYAFAYNIMSIISTIVSAISVVLYPMLKRLGDAKKGSIYFALVGVVLVVSFFCLTIYFPFSEFLSWFLPDYMPSLKILKYIFPSIALNSAINLVIYNYYKAENKAKSFLWISSIALFISFALNIVATLFESVIYITIATIITMLIWFVIADFGIKKHYNTKSYKHYMFIGIECFLFYFCTLLSWWIGLLIYITSILIFAVLFYYKPMKKLIKYNECNM